MGVVVRLWEQRGGHGGECSMSQPRPHAAQGPVSNPTRTEAWPQCVLCGPSTAGEQACPFCDQLRAQFSGAGWGSSSS